MRTGKNACPLLSAPFLDEVMSQSELSTIIKLCFFFQFQTVNFENFPIKTAHFTADGQKFMAGSQHFGHFFVYDMYAGKIIKVPWKEDKEQMNMQKFEISPTNDLVS